MLGLRLAIMKNYTTIVCSSFGQRLYVDSTIEVPNEEMENPWR